MACSGSYSGCGGGGTTNSQQMNMGTPNYNGSLKKPNAMVSQHSVVASFGPYGARKASEVIGRTKMPALPKKRTQNY